MLDELQGIQSNGAGSAGSASANLSHAAQHNHSLTSGRAAVEQAASVRHSTIDIRKQRPAYQQAMHQLCPYMLSLSDKPPIICSKKCEGAQQLSGTTLRTQLQVQKHRKHRLQSKA